MSACKCDEYGAPCWECRQEQARRTAEYWKQEHLAGNVAIEYLEKELDEYVRASRRLAIERAELRRQRDGLKAELEKLLDVLPPHVLVAPGEIGKQIAAAREALKLEIL